MRSSGRNELPIQIPDVPSSKSVKLDLFQLAQVLHISGNFQFVARLDQANRPDCIKQTAGVCILCLLSIERFLCWNSVISAIYFWSNDFHVL